MSVKKKNYAISVLKTRLLSHQDILRDKEWASGNDEADKQSRKILRDESKELKEAIRVLSKLHQPTVSGSVCDFPCCRSVGTNEIKSSVFYCDEHFNQ